MRNSIAAAALLSILCLSTQWTAAQASEALYFPASDDSWEAVDPASVGWDQDKLNQALDVAGARDSSGVVILYKGRIMAERYWESPNNSSRYRNMVMGRDSKGRAIEDVASAQKSVVAVLTGMAQERGYLQIDDSVSTYLGAGWSKASLEQESAISIRHLMSMNSGLGVDFSFEAAPNQKWLYNTPVYHVLMRVLVAATGMDRHSLTREWITQPLGMENSSWTDRPWASSDIAVGFSTTTRELARFGIMIQSGGRWGDSVIIEDKDFLTDMLRPSQSLNPAYGYLWWLNGQDFSLSAAAANRKNGALIASAPNDLAAMQGALDRKLYLVPSLDLIVTRLGASGRANGVSFNDSFWQALIQAVPDP